MNGFYLSHFMIHGKKSWLATIDNDKIEVGGPAVTEEECHHRVGVPPVAVSQEESLLIRRP